MFKLACNTFIKDCPFVAEGATSEEAIKNLTEHGASTHAEELAEMSKTVSQEEMAEKMKAAVTEE